METTVIPTRYHRAAELAAGALARRAQLAELSRDPIVSLLEARALLGIGETCAHKWIRSGKLHAVKIHSRWFVKLSVIRQLRG